jgi:hypothetical protein
MFARQDAIDAVAAVEVGFGGTPSHSPPTVPELRKWERENPKVRDVVHYEYGFWIAIVALSAVGVANTVRVFRDSAYDRDSPASATPQP